MLLQTACIQTLAVFTDIQRCIFHLTVLSQAHIMSLNHLMSQFLLDYGKNDLTLPAQILSEAQLLATQISKPRVSMLMTEKSSEPLYYGIMCVSCGFDPLVLIWRISGFMVMTCFSSRWMQCQHPSALRFSRGTGLYRCRAGIPGSLDCFPSKRAHRLDQNSGNVF